MDTAREDKLPPHLIAFSGGGRAAGPSDPAGIGEGDWAAWRTITLRSAGFPAEFVLTLADPELTAAADAVVADQSTHGRTPSPARTAYEVEYRSATQRLTAAIQKLARDPRFREAVTWQNPKLVRLCLDKLAAGEPRTAHGRGHELTAASYAQRYGLKNDTIGSTGPVGWVLWTDKGAPLEMDIADRLLARRTVYFEVWAINEVARTLTADPLIRPHVSPRLIAANRLDGSTMLIPGRPSISLTASEVAVLSLVDGERSALDIAHEMAWTEFPELGDPAATLELIDRLAVRDVLDHTLKGVIEAFPERTLQAKLHRISDPQVRDYASEILDRLLAARDRVSQASGDDVALEAAMAALAECFQEITGAAGERRAGQTYAGRTIAYEDTVRGVRVRLGPEFREALSRPMRLLLDSGRWILAQAASMFERELADIYVKRVEAQGGVEDVPLLDVGRRATPLLSFQMRGLLPQVEQIMAEFQRRWAAVLDLEPGARTVQRSSDEIAARVAELFPPAAPGWLTATYQSPDFMLAAADEQAVARGDYLLVIGETHLADNTMESRCFVQQHDDPESFIGWTQADVGGERRVYALPSIDIPPVNSRVSPPTAVLVPDYNYWTLYRESVHTPRTPMSAGDLVVRMENGRLMVRSTRSSFASPLLEVFSEFLSAGVANAFRPVASGAHTPRVTIDRLVVTREAWKLPANEVSWAFVKSEAERFVAARAWRLEQGMPERAFYKVPVEDKPTFVDFSSLILVNLLAKSIRRSAEEQGWVSLTELLPDLPDLWLRDANGSRYTSEFRMCVSDRLGRSLLAEQYYECPQPGHE
jgi:hypothetical protein